VYRAIEAREKKERERKKQAEERKSTVGGSTGGQGQRASRPSFPAAVAGLGFGGGGARPSNASTRESLLAHRDSCLSKATEGKDGRGGGLVGRMYSTSVKKPAKKLSGQQLAEVPEEISKF
jgi:hypothetical protein